MFRDRVDKNQFDGFLLYPQYVVSDGCFAGWGSAPSANFNAILAIVDSMVKYVRADNDRLLITGLSGGGYGAWRMVDNYPQRVAKIMPSASAGSVAGRAKFIHIPIWFATGGKDVDPSPATALYDYQKLRTMAPTCATRSIQQEVILFGTITGASRISWPK
jgi:predicted peptidase